VIGPLRGGGRADADDHRSRHIRSRDIPGVGMAELLGRCLVCGSNRRVSLREVFVMMGHEIAAEAFRAFERWRTERDPECEMDIMDAALAYSTYALNNGIEKYLDAAQPSPQENADV
jgi:hypothetical protein